MVSDITELEQSSTFRFKQPISREIGGKKYFLHGEQEVSQLFKGVAQEIASVERTPELQKFWASEFYSLLDNSEFTGAGRIMANARLDSLMKNYNNCFVIYVGDSMDEIYTALHEDALIGKAGGGVGFNISNLRPKGAGISSGGESSGPMSFLEVFDTSAKAIHTGGNRRAAHIVIMNVDHPDIEEFITYKQGDKNKRLTAFNISVGITDAFMQAVKDDTDWDLVFEGKIYKTVRAKYLYDLMMANMYEHNEPGVLFLDTVNKANNGHYMYTLDSTNPCVAKGTLVDTPQGQRKVEDIEVGDSVNTLHYRGYEPVKTIEVHEDTWVNKVVFGNGVTQYVTDAHIYHVLGQNGEIVKPRFDVLNVGDMVQYVPQHSDNHMMFTEIIDIEWHVRKDTVYDLYCEESDTWITEGLVQRGCGEQPLPTYGVCCLGAMILPTFVVNPFTDKAYFDIPRFENAVRKSVRFLDNVLSASDFPLDKIKERSDGDRRIGLGFTGLGDTFAKLGVIYGDNKSKAIVDLIGRIMRDTAYAASIELAKEKGEFPNLDRQQFLESGFVKELPEHLRTGIAEHGIRNIALLTVQPAGTISLTFGNNCSSGIEPIFSLQYVRNVTQDDGVTKVPQAVVNEAWLDYCNLHGREYDDMQDVPDYFITSDHVGLYESIEIQAIMQKYIDSSISKTLNLPAEFDLDDYHNLAMYAWEKGLKGMTTYNPRGSLAPILTTDMSALSNGNSSTRSKTWDAKKRPEYLPCDIHEIQVNKQPMIVLVGKDDEDPNTLYEVFVTKNVDREISVNRAKTGWIQKVRRGKYNLLSEDKQTVLVEDISSVFDDDDYAILCRLLSLMLRHGGIKLQFIIAQLNRTRRFNTFSKTVARVLKKYVQEGEPVYSDSDGVCPECGEPLVFAEGCKTCPSCFYSKCD